MYQRSLTLNPSRSALFLKCHYKDKEMAKSVMGRTWRRNLKVWEYPLQPEILPQLEALFPNLQVDPAVKVALKSITEKREFVEQIKGEGWKDVKPYLPMPVKVKPFQHQVLGYNIGLELNAVALLMEQGCGKTLTAIAIAGRWFMDGLIKRVLVVAPASVVPVWPMEFGTCADFNYEIAALDHPAVKDRIAFLENWKKNDAVLQVAVINYEATWRMEKELKAWGPDYIICDESQRIKTPSARQSKTMHRLGTAVKYRAILTGTPVTQGPLDFYSMYKFLDPSIFGKNYALFRSRYAVMGGYEGRQVIGYRNLPELTQKAHSIAFRVTKADALDLPEFTDQTLFCHLEPEARKLYQQMAQESIMQLESGTVTATNVLSQLLRLSQLTGGYAGSYETDGVERVSMAKFSLLKELCGDLLRAGRKVVIFARFVNEIVDIRSWLEEQGVGYSIIFGAVPKSERGLMVEKFQTDPECRVFIAQIQTAGLGITLHAADTAIFYSLDYNYANYDQCKARIHRIGQRNTCTYIHLIARGTVDAKVMRVLKKKGDMANLVVDNWRSLFELESFKEGGVIW